MKRKVGRPPKLSREQIIEAALADGISTFSMSSVARRLEVSHSGLYRYFTDHADLLNAAVESCFVSYNWPRSQDVPWRELLIGVGAAAWDFYETHPGIDLALLTMSGPTSTADELMLQWVEALVDQGFTAEDAGISLNFVLLLANTTSVNLDAVAAANIRTGADAAAHPHLQAISDSISKHEHGWFDIKLEIFLDGLERRVFA